MSASLTSTDTLNDTAVDATDHEHRAAEVDAALLDNLCPTHLAIFQLHQPVIFSRSLIPHAMRFGMACIGADLDSSRFKALGFRPFLSLILRRDQPSGDSDKDRVKRMEVNAHVLV